MQVKVTVLFSVFCITSSVEAYEILLKCTFLHSVFLL